MAFYILQDSAPVLNQKKKVTDVVAAEDKRIEEVAKLRHIVLFKFKESASEAEIKEAEEAFKALQGKIGEIKDFEWGLNNSPEHLNKGFTHGFLLTFDSEEGRDTYLPHPDHKALGGILDPILEDVLVLDYWTY